VRDDVPVMQVYDQQKFVEQREEDIRKLHK
jgi:hypothetical protein